MDELKKRQADLEIATFRFGIISEFVTGVRLDYGEKERLINEKVKRTYAIPYSKRNSISKSIIRKWINQYKKAGYRLEGLFPKTRSDKGNYRKLDPSIRLAIKEMKQEYPKLTVPTIIKKLKHKKTIKFNENISLSLIYSFLKKENLHKINEQAKDKRIFEANAPNEIWQSDVMHGPMARLNGINRKTYLIAILDDYSRLIIHAEFYPNERLDNLKDCLKKSLEKRGLPQKFYIDNGSCFRALNLDQIAALLGIAITHSRPYTPQGRGKIERWFKTVRDSFLPLHTEQTYSLNELNEALDNWVSEYNNHTHGSTKQTPYKRYKMNLECVRPAPKDLMDYFRMIAFRHVRKDRTFKLNGVFYEAPVGLIDRKIEIRYHKENPEKVEIFFNNQSFGIAEIADPHINASVGRDWKSLPGKDKNDVLEDNHIQTGRLFEGDDHDQL